MQWIGHPSDRLREKFGLPPSQVIAGVYLDGPVGDFDGKDEEGKILFECKDSKDKYVLVPFLRLNIGDHLVPLQSQSKDELI